MLTEGTQGASAAFHIREAAAPADAEGLCDLLNAIITRGGTTALEKPLTPAEFANLFLVGAHSFFCLVAVDQTKQVLGFQALGRHPQLPEDWADIATFARMEPKMPGVGTALFNQTRRRAGDLGLRAINAAIRADNRGGLAYYEKMGFRTYDIARGVPLQDGTPVDRVFKRYSLE